MRVRHVRFHRTPHVSIGAVAACLVDLVAKVHRLPPKVVPVEARGIAPVAMDLANVVSGAHVGAERCPVVPVFLASPQPVSVLQIAKHHSIVVMRAPEAHLITTSALRITLTCVVNAFSSLLFHSSCGCCCIAERSRKCPAGAKCPSSSNMAQIARSTHWHLKRELHTNHGTQLECLIWT
jgi:hypothetical protein